MNRILTVEETAKILRIARMTVVRKLRKGELKGRHIAYNDWQVNENDLQMYLENNLEYKIGQTPNIAPV